MKIETGESPNDRNDRGMIFDPLILWNNRKEKTAESG